MQMLLHEMGHDWIAHNLDQRERDAFVARLGLAVWEGSDVEWADRGIEQAAMIIAWGLGEHCEIPANLGAMDQPTIAEEFRRLTKTPLCTTP